MVCGCISNLIKIKWEDRTFPYIYQLKITTVIYNGGHMIITGVDTPEK
jgi:hypothetical protein